MSLWKKYKQKQERELAYDVIKLGIKEGIKLCHQDSRFWFDVALVLALIYCFWAANAVALVEFVALFNYITRNANPRIKNQRKKK